MRRDMRSRSFEVGPRDGLQNEAREDPGGREDRADRPACAAPGSGGSRWRVSSARNGCRRWPTGPRFWRASRGRRGCRYAALDAEHAGLRGRMAAGADEVAMFGSASEGFTRANINCSIDESLERFRPVLEAADAANVPVRGYVSCVTDCPYDGPTRAGAGGAGGRRAVRDGLLRDLAGRYDRAGHAGAGRGDAGRR